MNILARRNEISILDEFLKSDKAEFLAIYGRRRVGKTFLIKSHFQEQNCIFFSVTGIEKGTFLQQREVCCKQISNTFYDGIPIETPKAWLKVFELLHTAITRIAKNKKVVIFFDEFPWLAKPRTNLLQALEYFWNQYWSIDKRVKLIVCGSLSSWIIRNIINNTGGLYNRVTYRLKLEPLNLYETKTFLDAKGIKLANSQILSIYMVMGGIPLYLDQIKKGMSANQVVDRVCFSKNGLLVDEQKELFKSLFSNSEIYYNLTKEIAKYRYGIAKNMISKNLGIAQGGRLEERLRELEEAGFIISFLPYGHNEKGKYYRVVDEYTMFYFKWIEPQLNSISGFTKANGYWLEQSKSSSFKAWCGYAFESVCYRHIAQIRRKLNLMPSALPYGWKFVPKQKSDDNGAQIDLLFDRNDNAITICEIKCTEEPFVIDKQYAEKLNKKIAIFEEKTKTNKQIFLALISVNSVKSTIYSEEMLSGLVVLDDLFVAD